MGDHHQADTELSLQSTLASPLVGTASVPGDKSISHRSLLLSSQVLGTTVIHGLLEGEDVINTARALRQLGVTIESEAQESGNRERKAARSTVPSVLSAACARAAACWTWAIPAPVCV